MAANSTSTQSARRPERKLGALRQLIKYVYMEVRDIEMRLIEILGEHAKLKAANDDPLERRNKVGGEPHEVLTQLSDGIRLPSPHASPCPSPCGKKRRVSSPLPSVKGGRWTRLRCYEVSIPLRRRTHLIVFPTFL